MKSVAIYMEGGGDTADGKARLRRGMSGFLRELRAEGRARKLRVDAIPCGTRRAAFDAFRNALRMEPEVFNVLLVDSDDAVTSSRRSHLEGRGSWNFAGVAEEQVHLMVTVMETWLVADPDTLAEYYGQGFNPNPLPKAMDLETVDKARIAAALLTATRNTSKGEYHKLRHASDLLQRIDTGRSRQRCRHCRDFLAAVESQIRSA